MQKEEFSELKEPLLMDSPPPTQRRKDAKTIPQDSEKDPLVNPEEKTDESRELVSDYQALESIPLVDLPRTASLQVEVLDVERNNPDMAMETFLHRLGISVQDMEEFKMPELDDSLSISTSY